VAIIADSFRFDSFSCREHETHRLADAEASKLKPERKTDQDDQSYQDAETARNIGITLLPIVKPSTALNEQTNLRPS
jgi:hypothetical protein